MGLKLGKIPLPQRFIHADGHRIGQIQAALAMAHGNTHAGFGMLHQQRFRQTGILPPEHQVRAVGITDIGVPVQALGGEVEKRSDIFP